MMRYLSWRGLVLFVLAITLPFLAIGNVMPSEKTIAGPASPEDAATEAKAVSRTLASEATGLAPTSERSSTFEPTPGVVLGSDGRQLITPTTSEPWRSIASLEVQFDSGTVLCTGFFIGPDVVATAGHCVYDFGGDGWANAIRVIPGHDGPKEPFGAQFAITAFTNDRWTEEGDGALDFGGVILADSMLGNAVGWFRYGSLNDDGALGITGARANLAGYPGDSPVPFQQWFHSEDITATTFSESIKCNPPDPCVKTSKGVASYLIDTTPGQSGSPVWLYNGGQRAVVAIHTSGPDPGRCFLDDGLRNCGTLMTQSVANIYEEFGAKGRLPNVYPPIFPILPIAPPFITEPKPPPAPDLTVAKTDSPDPVTVGQPLTYELTVSNIGLAAATAVVVEDDLPPEVETVSSVSPGQGSCSDSTPPTIRCELGNLSAGSSTTVEIVVIAPPNPGPITNCATVDPDETVIETDKANNTACEDTTVQMNGGDLPDLTISKTDFPDPVAGQGQVTYTVTVANQGIANADLVVIQDTLPTNGSFKIAAPSQGFCDPPAGNVLTCNLAKLAPSASATVEVVINAPTGPATMTNCAEVDPNNTIAESDETNNGPVCEATAVEPDGAKVTVRAGSVTVPPGGTVTVRVDALLNPPTISQGTFTVEVKYDTSLLTGVSCTPDPNALFDFSQCSPTFAPGVARCTGVSISGLSGAELSLCDITFLADSAAPFGTSTPLVVNCIVKTDPGGVAIPCNEENGEITIGPQGDVNCDGFVNVVDALFILQFEVGLRVDSGGCPLPPPPPDTLNAAGGDVNKDGVTNVVDALFILQCEVGLKPGANMPFCAGSIVVDGNPADWQGIAPLITDAPGDVSEPCRDLLSLRVTDDGTSVFFLHEFAGDVAECGTSFLFLSTDLDASTGCTVFDGTEYAVAFWPSQDLFWLGDWRDCSKTSSDFPGALTAAWAGPFIEASVPIETLRILTPDFTAFDITTSADTSPVTRYELGGS